MKGKKSVEESLAVKRLHKQAKKAKRDADHYLPKKIRLKRFDTFATSYQDFMSGNASIATFTRGDQQRFEKARKEFGHDPITDPSRRFDFLNYCRDNGIKEFGSGSKLRTEFEKEGMKGASEDYLQARSLTKLAKFGRRRKAETATINAVEATGHALDLVGTYTAEADFGATKISGKATRATSSAYKALKSGAKRGRRVHKVRTAKNELGYGGQSERGFRWGAKTFFAGDVARSQSRVKKSLKAASQGQPPSGKAVNAPADADKLDALKRKLTNQAVRRAADLVRCLGSRNDTIYHRAKQILHVIAETNLAGAIRKVKNRDLDEFRTWSQAVQAGTADPATVDDYKKRRTVIKGIIKGQLGGVGG